MIGIFNKNQNPKIKTVHQKRKDLRNLVKQKKYDDALKLGSEILRQTPYEHNVLFIVGGIYYMKKKYRTAISFFEKALEIGSYDVEVLILKANCHHVVGETTNVIQCCNKIKEIDPKNKAVSELLSKIPSTKN